MGAPAPAPVLFVVDGLGLSGKTKALTDLAVRLDRERFLPAVCSFDPEESPLRTRLAGAGVPIHDIPCRAGLNLRIVLQLAGLARRIRPAVVHCYNPRAMLYGGLAARLARRPGAIGSLSAFGCQVPDREYSFLPQQLFTLSRRNRWRNRIAAGLMRRIVAVSPSLGERFCGYNGIPLSRLCVVPYGIDVAAPCSTPEDVEAYRRQLGVREGEVTIGSVGRLVEQKDYDTQLRAFALAAGRFPGLRMILAGDGPLRPELERLVSDLGIGDRVRFLGHCESVPLLLRSLDVFVLASKFEPYGVAILEAKAAGVAIVATRVNEIPEIVAEGRSGLLVPPEQPERLAGAFVRLAGDPALRGRLGRQALQEAAGRHSIEVMVAGYERLYDAVRGRPARVGTARAATGEVAVH